MSSKETHANTATMLYSAAEIQRRITELAKDIIAKYSHANVIFVCVLNGGLPFSAQLMNAITTMDPSFHPRLTFIAASRYGIERTCSAIQITQDLPERYHDLSDSNVIILDDMIDEGGTIKALYAHLEMYKPKSMQTLVLIKKESTKNTYKIDHLSYGFTAPNKWLVGMGMDDSKLAPEAYRWSDWVGFVE